MRAWSSCSIAWSWRRRIWSYAASFSIVARKSSSSFAAMGFQSLSLRTCVLLGVTGMPTAD